MPSYFCRANRGLFLINMRVTIGAYLAFPAYLQPHGEDRKSERRTCNARRSTVLL